VNAPQTVLIVRAGALGDIVLLRGVVASLRRAGAAVTLLAPARPASALVGPGPEEARAALDWESPAVARMITETQDTRTLRAQFGRFDAVLCYSRNTEVVCGLSPLAPRVVSWDPEPRDAHAALWLARPLRSLGVEAVAPSPLRATGEEAARAAEWTSRLPPGFLSIHPGSGSARKNWPVERYAALVRRVSPDRRWLLLLGPADRDGEALAGEPGAVVARDLPPRAVGALLSHAGVHVGNDSGLTHVAAAWGAPTVALFGPTDPEAWAPVGPQVHLVRSADGRMESIAVADVESYVRGARTSSVV
jgi:hypothetical protein